MKKQKTEILKYKYFRMVGTVLFTTFRKKIGK